MFENGGFIIILTIKLYNIILNTELLLTWIRWVTYGALHMTEFIIIFDEKHNNKINKDKLTYIKHSNIAKKVLLLWHQKFKQLTLIKLTTRCVKQWRDTFK